jgi:hypothetical protein
MAAIGRFSARCEMHPLEAIAVYTSGKSRSFIGALRDQKRAEVLQLERAIAHRQNPLDHDNFVNVRDRKRVRELEREIRFLSALFGDPQPDHSPL